jgi:methionyl aminopeptidase
MTTSFTDSKIQAKYQAMKTGGHILSEIIHAAKDLCLPGTPSSKVDQYCYQAIKSNGCQPAFLGYQGFPATLVLCLNNEVVHGIPTDKKIISAGDLVTLDLGLVYQGYVTDMAISFVAGTKENNNIYDTAQNLINTTRLALDEVIKIIKPGLHIGDIGNLIEKTATDYRFKVIYECAGHGVGTNMHESPTIANYGHIGAGPKLSIGQTIAIEPIMSVSTNHTYTLSDGWTMVTDDDSIAAQSEHTLIVTEDGCEILTI